MKKNNQDTPPSHDSSDMPTDPCEDNDPGRRLFGMPPNGDEPPPSSDPPNLVCHCAPPLPDTTAEPTYTTTTSLHDFFE